MNAAHVLAELADRRVARAGIPVHRDESVIGDEVADDRAALLVHMDDPRSEPRVRRELLDANLPPPTFDRAVAGDLEHERVPPGVDAIDAGTRQSRGHPRDRRRRTAKFGGEARLDVASVRRQDRAGGCARSCRSIHDVPKLSRSIANRWAKKVSSMRMKICPPSESSA